MDETGVAELAHEFADIGAQLRGEADNTDVLVRITELAVKHIPGCTWASITMLNQLVARSLATSDPVAAQADTLQYQLGEGPCLSTAQGDSDVLLMNTGSDRRWPSYAQALRTLTPIRTVLSLRLAAERASLNLYSPETDGFTGQAINVGAVLAAHTSSAVALHLAEESASNLKVALASSRQIGIAVGILMAYHKVNEEDAFDLLRDASQHLNVKLRQIAAGVVETGTLPEQLSDVREYPGDVPVARWAEQSQG